MTIIAAQCRLSSSRLPSKALLPLGGKTVLDWTLAAMKKVKVDEYYVATDEASYDELKPVCERNGFKIFKGPLEDVLARYCNLIEESKADIVIRATCDNPFL
ncbi:MAG: NTP transferase domain-containing protein, partial [Treponema sp.]|nr:NTP transferase domain-containing protein [Treponema sp.]